MKDYKNKPLKKIVIMAKQGDASALNELVKRYSKTIYNEFFLFDMKQNLPDMAQDTFLKLTKYIKTLKNPDKFDAWLHRIVKNIIFDSLRQAEKNNNRVTNPIKSVSLEFCECVIDDKKTPDENILDCELKQKIDSAIIKLSPLLRTIIILREIEGLSYDEISKWIGINVGTVKSRLARARIKLRKELESYIEG